MTRWRRSTHSGSGDSEACVEVAVRRGRVWVRDSKHPDRTPLVLPARSVAALLRRLKRQGS